MCSGNCDSCGGCGGNDNMLCIGCLCDPCECFGFEAEAGVCADCGACLIDCECCYDSVVDCSTD